MSTDPKQNLRDLICEAMGMDCRHYGDRHANDCEEVRDAILAAGWVSPEEAGAREAAARREALLEAAELGLANGYLTIAGADWLESRADQKEKA